MAKTVRLFALAPDRDRNAGGRRADFRADRNEGRAAAPRRKGSANALSSDKVTALFPNYRPLNLQTKK